MACPHPHHSRRRPRSPPGSISPVGASSSIISPRYSLPTPARLQLPDPFFLARRLHAGPPCGQKRTDRSTRLATMLPAATTAGYVSLDLCSRFKEKRKSGPRSVHQEKSAIMVVGAIYGWDIVFVHSELRAKSLMGSSSNFRSFSEWALKLEAK
jgi:hypothetical protein